jgi:hypothetical protein
MYHTLLSMVAFNFNLRRYIKVAMRALGFAVKKEAGLGSILARHKVEPGWRGVRFSLVGVVLG